jgi:hypothetical protein
MRVGLFFFGRGPGGWLVRYDGEGIGAPQHFWKQVKENAGGPKKRWTLNQRGKLENSHLARVIRASSLYTETCSS